MIGPTLHVRVLERAAEILGGRQALREHLRVAMRDLEAWLEAREPVPTYIFLAASDVLGADASGAVRHSRQVVSAAQQARERAKQVRKRSLDALLDATLRSAVHGTSAARANIQLVAPDGLRIARQLGFEAPFLKFFECVNDGGSACGRAMRDGERVIVPDVAAHPVFDGTPAREVMLQARCLAVQSTPLFGEHGRLVGVLSTHYETPHEPKPDELAALDLAAEAVGRRLAAVPAQD